jgi:hypothetical protein
VTRIRFRTAFAVGAVVCSLAAIPSSALAEPGVRVSTAAGSVLQALPRATSDRPDDFSGKQVHVFYVVPSDGVDRGLDTAASGGIPSSVASWQAWLKGQTAGRGIRVDTYQGQPDITFFRLAASDAAVASHGAFVREQIENELRPAGFNVPGRIYAVYYDGGSTWSCGGAGPMPTTGGSVTAIYLQGTPPGAPGCATNPLGGSPPGYLEFAMLHEIVHTMGFVPSCAPHVTLVDHASDSRYDLMWAGNQPWGTNEPDKMQLDVGHDDYYLAGIPGCRDMSVSPYLAGEPGAPALTSATGGNNAVALGWSAPVSDGGFAITGYRVYRGTSAGAETLLTSTGAVTGYNDASAVNGTTYFYKVSAVNAISEGSLSNELSAAPTGPKAPSNLTATPLSRSRIGLSWTDNSTGETGFRIERSWNGSSDWRQVATVAANATTYVHARQPALTTSFYRVRATNGVGSSVFSNVASATTLGS